MLNLSYECPENFEGQTFTIMRVPAGKSLQGIITCSKPLGTPTHFWGGRTIPCTPPSCEACKAGSFSRYHFYTTVYDHRSQLHFLLELTAAAAEPIIQYGRDRGTTLGCGIRCNRIPEVSNGRIHIQTTMTDPQKYPIPEEPNLPAILSRLWNIPLEEIKTPDTKKIIPAIELTPESKLRHANRLRQSVSNNGGK
jgi:hypothetical protein